MSSLALVKQLCPYLNVEYQLILAHVKPKCQGHPFEYDEETLPIIGVYFRALQENDPAMFALHHEKVCLGEFTKKLGGWIEPYDLFPDNDSPMCDILHQPKYLMDHDWQNALLSCGYFQEKAELLFWLTGNEAFIR